MSQKTYISSAYWMRNMETIQIGLMLELQRTNVHLPTLQNQLFSRRRGFQMALDPPQLLFNSSPVSLYICGVCIALVQYTHHIRLTIASHSILMRPDMEFVKKITPTDFQAKNFTPSISVLVIKTQKNE